MITSAQIRAARALIRWSARELAEAAGISLPTVQRLEASEGVPSTSVQTMGAIRAALEAAGVVFVDENGQGPGVRLVKVRKFEQMLDFGRRSGRIAYVAKPETFHAQIKGQWSEDTSFDLSSELRASNGLVPIIREAFVVGYAVVDPKAKP